MQDCARLAQAHGAQPLATGQLHLRSRVRDDALLNRLLSEVRAHEKEVPKAMLALTPKEPLA